MSTFPTTPTPPCPNHSKTLAWCLEPHGDNCAPNERPSSPPCGCSECSIWVQFHQSLETDLVHHFQEQTLPSANLRYRIQQTILQHSHAPSLLHTSPYELPDESNLLNPGLRPSPFQVALQIITPVLQVVPWIILPPWFLYHALTILPWETWSQRLNQYNQSLHQSLDQFPILHNLPLDYTLLAIPLILLLASLLSLPYLTRNAHRLVAEF